MTKAKSIAHDNMSHLLQMRGLKQQYKKNISSDGVASFTDAWIETVITSYFPASTNVASFTDAWIETYSEISGTPNLSVASFTDAWIETCMG